MAVYKSLKIEELPVKQAAERHCPLTQSSPMSLSAIGCPLALGAAFSIGH